MTFKKKSSFNPLNTIPTTYVFLRFRFLHVSNTLALSSINLRVDAHLCKLRDIRVACFYFLQDV